ncbi:hypothetical protein C0J52_28315 [Blattella germanica]|nr:hypothetical protein C0J52_28315 [Blattella germanica]
MCFSHDKIIQFLESDLPEDLDQVSDNEQDNTKVIDECESSDDDETVEDEVPVVGVGSKGK